ncbi:hypothetical protein [Azospirillum sp. TSO22-1]|uniref:hypothetical protein n=1 Tax=Azospirillum sp. TSO22-1 TaxID=716789 RepID=UPI0011B7E093|nr:hypothetical protein [Azospirillum sp. TSO22-1]
MSGIHLKLEDVIVPEIHQYESTIGSSVSEDDLPYEYSEIDRTLPVYTTVTEQSRSDGARSYQVTVNVKIEEPGKAARLETRHFDVDHNTNDGSFRFKRTR